MYHCSHFEWNKSFFSQLIWWQSKGESVLNSLKKIVTLQWSKSKKLIRRYHNFHFELTLRVKNFNFTSKFVQLSFWKALFLSLGPLYLIHVITVLCPTSMSFKSSSLWTQALPLDKVYGFIFMYFSSKRCISYSNVTFYRKIFYSRQITSYFKSVEKSVADKGDM